MVTKAPRDGIIIKKGSTEAKQISAKIKEQLKLQTRIQESEDTDSNGPPPPKHIPLLSKKTDLVLVMMLAMMNSSQ